MADSCSRAVLVPIVHGRSCGCGHDGRCGHLTGQCVADGCGWGAGAGAGVVVRVGVVKCEGSRECETRVTRVCVASCQRSAVKPGSSAPLHPLRARMGTHRQGSEWQWVNDMAVCARVRACTACQACAHVQQRPAYRKRVHGLSEGRSPVVEEHRKGT